MAISQNLQQKTVLITGCSSGFGQRLVTGFLKRNWRVIATMRNADNRRDIFDSEIKRYGDQLIIADLDITSNEQRLEITKQIENLDNARLDCLVNNAGYALFGALENCSEEQVRQQYEVNLIAPTLLTKQCLPLLRGSKGSVINVSSIMSFVGFPLASVYCSSKAGLTMLSESLKHELAPLGIKVHAVEPGGFRTGFVDNSQWGEHNIEDYQSQTAGFHQLQNRINQRKGNDPEPVIQRILDLADGKKSSLRNQIGKDALLSKLVHKSLPDEIRIKLMGSMFKHILQ